MSNEVLSQEEIEAMLNQAGQIEENDAEPASDEGAAQPEVGTPAAGGDAVSFDVGEYLSQEEQDLLGEVGNICMGTSATTMSTLLSKRVTITTPKIFIHNLSTLSDEYPAPIVVADVSYTEGLNGDNLLILKEYDVALITNSLLGESTDIDPDNIELNEIHLSAIGEVMNQMIGSSATALADLLHKTINISTPVIKKLVMHEEKISDSFANLDEMLVKITFAMEIEGLLTSEIMQVIPLDFAKEMSKGVIESIGAEPTNEPLKAPDMSTINATSSTYDALQGSSAAPQQAAPAPAAAPPPQQMVASAPAPVSHNVIKEQQNVNVQTAQFPTFRSAADVNVPLDNIEMLLDVPMQVTVELGKARKMIKEVLEFNMGSVIVLDKVAGEAIDVLVNGKRIGRGEVVVIDDNYGIRITEINMPSAADLME